MIDSIDWQTEFLNLSCEDALEVLQCFLLSICRNLIPFSKPPKPGPSQPPWMCREIKKLINKKKRMLDMYMASPSEPNLLNYKKIRNSLTATIRQKKSNYERDLVRGCRLSPKPLFAYVNSKRKTQPLSIIKNSKGIIKDDCLIAEELRNFFSLCFHSANYWCFL
jgi:hypothetical protein